MLQMMMMMTMMKAESTAHTRRIACRVTDRRGRGVVAGGWRRGDHGGVARTHGRRTLEVAARVKVEQAAGISARRFQVDATDGRGVRLVVVVVDVNQLLSDAGRQLGHRLARRTTSTPARQSVLFSGAATTGSTGLTDPL